VFGALLCVLYHRTGSLLPCIVLHALNNALALGVSQSWEAPQVIALMLGAAVAVTAFVLPFSRPAALQAA
jgi:membrane protease YdiL (CAAX protease family)